VSPARAVEVAIVIVATSIACPPSAGVTAASVVAFVVLAVQIVVVRPGLTRRSDQVLALAAAGLLLLSS
jgi:hypothetical protein